MAQKTRELIVGEGLGTKNGLVIKVFMRVFGSFFGKFSKGN